MCLFQNRSHPYLQANTHIGCSVNPGNNEQQVVIIFQITSVVSLKKPFASRRIGRKVNTLWAWIWFNFYISLSCKIGKSVTCVRTKFFVHPDIFRVVDSEQRKRIWPFQRSSWKIRKVYPLVEVCIVCFFAFDAALGKSYAGTTEHRESAINSERESNEVWIKSCLVRIS